MISELRLVVALVAHGNAQLRGAPCSCRWGAVDGATADGIQEWRASLAYPTVRRLWAAHFNNDKGPGRWGIEVESADGAEVWLAQLSEGQPALNKLFFNVPELPRLLNLKEAEARLRQAVEASGDRAAASILEGGASAALPHLLPDRGLSPEAILLAQAAARILLTLPEEPSLLRGSSLGALLVAIHAG